MLQVCEGAAGVSAGGRQAGGRTHHRSRCPAPRGALPPVNGEGADGPAGEGRGWAQPRRPRGSTSTAGPCRVEVCGGWRPGHLEQRPQVSRLVTEERVQAQSPCVALGSRPGVCLRTPAGREGRAEWPQRCPQRAWRMRGGSGRWPRVQAGRLAREGAGRLARGAGGGRGSSARCCWTQGEAGSWRGTWLSCWKCTRGREGGAMVSSTGRGWARPRWLSWLDGAEAEQTEPRGTGLWGSPLVQARRRTSPSPSEGSPLAPDPHLRHGAGAQRCPLHPARPGPEGPTARPSGREERVGKGGARLCPRAGGTGSQGPRPPGSGSQERGGSTATLPGPQGRTWRATKAPWGPGDAATHSGGNQTVGSWQVTDLDRGRWGRGQPTHPSHSRPT